MTQAQFNTREYFAKNTECPINVSQYSWEIRYFPTPRAFLDHESELLTPDTFPSVAACKRYVEEMHPEVWYYDLILVNSPSSCLLPYSNTF